MQWTGICFLFFLSGFNALVNEILWQRHLYLILGVSTAATSAVLAAFMLGLAGGAIIFGPIADRCARPLRVYGLLEGGVELVFAADSQLRTDAITWRRD
jgi:MFS family permease